jgi:hypothetical protein
MTLRDGARLLRGAVLMGLTWAAVWGGLIGGGIELAANIIPDLQFAKLADIWIFELGVPGFIAGGIFSLLLSAAQRARRFDDLSLGRFAALGAASGLLLTALLATLGLGNSAFPALLLRALLISIPVTALSAATAASVLTVARSAARTRTFMESPTRDRLHSVEE